MGVIEIDSIFTEEDFSFIVNEFENSNFTNNKSWQTDLKQFSKPVKTHNIKNENTITIINKAFKKIDIPILKLGVNFSCSFYKWESGCYIPWHSDSKYSAGMTIYLNDDWDYKNGGLFLYKENDTIKTIIPKKNKGVLQVGGIPHSTTIVSNHSKPRKTIQIFFDKFNETDKYIL
jgi:Rps23 Pro-64 3,4-dihydroxylase Tpa1-like proline 4-hydroxylase